jgi:hypothetical protein
MGTVVGTQKAKHERNVQPLRVNRLRTVFRIGLHACLL